MTTAREQLQDEFERGASWNPRKNPDDPNPLYGTGVKWSQAPTDYGPADFLTVRDDDGKLWSILVGSFQLKKELLEGEISVWDDANQKFNVVETRGPVREGELIAIQLVGEKQYRNKQGIVVSSPKYRVARREGAPVAAVAASSDPIEAAEAIIAAEQGTPSTTEGIPW